MTRRPVKLYLYLFPAFSGVALFCLILMGLAAYGLFDRLLTDEETRNLAVQSRILTGEFDYLLSAGKIDLVDDRCDALGKATGYRYTVILRNGNVIGDSAVKAPGMENHLSRPEVQKALQGVPAVDIRESRTTGEAYLYAAVPLDGGRMGVLRIARPYNQILGVLDTFYFRFLLILLLCLGVALLLSLGLARKLGRSLQRIVAFVRGVSVDESPLGEVETEGFPFEVVELKDCIVGLLSRFKLKVGRLDRLAHYDSLTGLPNRTRLYQVMEEALKSAGGEDRYAVLFFDIDRFKEVNDTLGHRAGDLLLTEVARRLETLAGEDRILARLGGDEFCGFLKLRHGSGEAREVSRRIDERILTPFRVEGRELVVSLSVGIALFPEDGRTRRELLHAADMAMYEVKRHRSPELPVEAGRSLPDGR